MQQFDRRASPTDQPLWIDLGCGDSKQPGFIGIDRFALPGVDIVCDLNRGIPIASDSADYILASHSLEHLRDLPATIIEIYRVCKDRALVTIIAPYDATRLNRANPYHFQAWNEHTARFFTTENAPTIVSADYRFPSAEHWGLQASDLTQSDIELRCLRMEFLYLPPYRGLDEETKRTLRHSLSDVCDQMALYLLVVKSPITQEELSSRATRIQFPVPPAFEARRRAEADVSAQNLFSELADMPARIAELSTKANEEVGLLGDEMRRFIQRLDHVDRALVAETQETRRALSELVTAGRTLSERMTAINSAMTRRMQAAAEELRGELTENLKSVTESQSAAAEELRGQLTESLKSVTESQSAQARFGDQILHHLVAERRARADRSFRPIRFLRRYRQRGADLRAIAGGELPRLWQGPEAPPAAFRLQLGTFLEASVARIYPLTAAGSHLRGIEIGIAAIFPPLTPSAIADFELLDGRNTVLRTGSVILDQSCGSVPISIGFEPLRCEPGQPFTLKLVPRANVERIGVQVFEWHRITRLLRRVPELRLAYRGQY